MVTETEDPSFKKNYKPPVLIRYGTMEELTKTLGIRGNFDNALKLTRTTLR